MQNSGIGPSDCPNNADNCYAAAGGNIYKTTNGFSSMSLVSSIPSASINSLHCIPNSNTCYAAGYEGLSSGKLFKSTDGGATWLPEQLPSAPFKLYNVSCTVDGSTCYVSSSLGILYRNGPVSSDAIAPSIVNNMQAGDVWRSSNSGTFDIDFSDTGGSKLAQIQIRACSTNMDCGDIADWTVIKKRIAADTYTTDLSISDYLWNELREGDNHISVRAFDGNGNGAVSASLFNLRKDTIPPGASAWVNDGTGADIDCASNTTQLSANWAPVTDEGSGVSDYSYAIGSAPGASNIVNWKSAGAATLITETGLSLVSGNSYYVSVRAVDGGGKSGPIVSTDGIRIDTEAPSSVITTPPDSAFMNSLSSIQGTASDGASPGVASVEVAIIRATDTQFWNGTSWQSGEAWLSATGSTAWSLSTQLPSWEIGKNYIIRSRATDMAGNVETPSPGNTFNFTDATPPGVIDNQVGDNTLRSTNPGAIYDVDFIDNSGAGLNYAQYTVWSATGMSGVQIIPWTIIVNNINSASYTVNWGVNFNSLASGTNYVSVRAADKSGNTSPASMDVFYIKKAGIDWVTQVSGTSSAMKSIFCPVSEKTCYAVGLAGTILKTINGGANWTAQTSNTTDSLWSVHCPEDNDTCYAAGYNNTILKTTNGGANWTKLSPPNGGFSYIRCSDNLTCFVISSGGLFATYDGGSNWASKNFGPGMMLFSFDCPLDSQTCYAILADTGTSIEKTSNGGSTWTTQLSSDISLYSVHCPVDAVSCFAVGDVGLIEHTSNGGTTWTEGGSNTSVKLRSVDCRGGATICYAVGDSGTIITTNDSIHWSPMLSGTTQNLRFITCPTDNSACYAVGDAGTILKKTIGPSETIPPVIIDNQNNDDILHGATNTVTYDVDLFDGGGSMLKLFQVRACTTNANCGDAAQWFSVRDQIRTNNFIDNWALPSAFWNLLPDGKSYISVRVFDMAGNNTESGPLFYVNKDGSSPVTDGAVRDGLGADINYVNATSSLSANWNPASDPQSGITGYMYGISTHGARGVAPDLAGWTDIGNVTHVTHTGLPLTEGARYHIHIKAINGVGATSEYIVSNGQYADRTAPGTISPFSATAADSIINLLWTPPSDIDLSGVKIIRKSGGFPANVNDGTVIYDGAATATSDLSVQNGTVYYYSAFAYDRVPNFSTAAYATATPAVGNFSIHSGWNQMGVSKQGAALNTATDFGGATCTYEIIGYDGQYTNLSKETNVNLVFMGGYWIYSDSDRGQISVGGADYTNASATVNLKAGWNMFSIPFSTGIPWDDAHASIMCGGSLSPLKPLYHFENDIYAVLTPNTNSSLSVWKAYFMFVSQACTLTLVR